jgi:tol-pal system protein YbgF
MRFMTKPTLVVGFFSYCWGVTALSQDYIDVEAERAAQRQSRAAQAVLLEPSDSTMNPIDTTQPDTPVGTGAVVQSGIRPYTGTTTLVVPVEDPSSVTPSMGDDNSLGGLVIRIQRLQEEIMRLNGRVEEQADQIRKLQEQGLERYIDLDRRLAQLNTATSAEGGGDSDLESIDDASALPSVAGAPAPEVGEKAAYRNAYELVKGRSFDQAVVAFTEFLSSYPLGHYAPNAHYWLGELYLVVTPAEPELARQNFKLLLDQYPDHNKVPDTLYKLGRVHFLKGNREQSRDYLNRVIAEHPSHPAAQYAQDFIDQNF